MTLFVGRGSSYSRAALSETRYENVIFDHADQLFPGWHYGRWKPLIVDDEGRAARPDALMISHALTEWAVVEVELASHSVRGHIRPQLDTLSRGMYAEALVPTMIQAIPAVQDDEDALRTLVIRSNPALVCIADGQRDELRRVCRDFFFELIVLEPYICAQDNSAGLYSSEIGERYRQRVIRNSWGIGRTGSIIGDRESVIVPPGFPRLEWVNLDIAGLVHSCSVVTLQGQRYLYLPRVTAIPPSGPLALEAISLDSALFRLRVLEKGS
jgi:hypothetical protein